MTARRLALGAAGLVALVAALLTGTAEAVPVDALVSVLGNDYLFVAAFGCLGLAIAATAVVSGRSANLEQASMPDPERPVSAPPPGTDFDAEVGTLRLSLPLYGRRRRAAVRERLRAAATGLVMRTTNCDRETARERVESGEWTADPTVAAFLGRGSAGGVELRLRALRRGQTAFQYLVERTVAELVRRAGGEER